MDWLVFIIILVVGVGTTIAYQRWQDRLVRRGKSSEF